MAKKINPPKRVCPKFFQDMDSVLQERVSKGLIKIKDAKFPKATELLTRTQGYQLSLKELKIKREKKKTYLPVRYCPFPILMLHVTQ